MFLSKLEIFGFKSFAQKFELNLDGGITSIVGPNGCGKTNVVDAIRWVLGEQSARSLRSFRMEDVIFNGSRNRAPLSMAEVSLTVKNDKGILPLDYSEVTVTRRLFRSGESDYLINKTPCRLMDINNLFMDTGMGSHAYSVMEQSMVDSILSESAEDRRKIFEEAAGITKYKFRRKSALLKLSATQQDLLRIGDIIGEVEKRVNSLRNQVRKAERYQSYLGRVKNIELKLGAYNHSKIMKELKQLSREIDGWKERMNGNSREISIQDALFEKFKFDILEKEESLSGAVKLVNENISLVHGKENSIAVARERIGYLTKLIERFKKELIEFQEKLIELRDIKVSCGDNISRLSVLIEEEKSKRLGIESELAEIESELKLKRDNVELRRSDILESLRAYGERKNNFERMKARYESIASRLESIDREKARTDLSSKDKKQYIGILKKRSELAETILNNIAEEKSRTESELASLETKIEELRENESSLKVEIEGIKSKRDLLIKLKDSYEGFSEGTKAVLSKSDIKPRIRSLVADLIEVSEEYSPAITAALEDKLQFLVVDDTEVVKASIGFLKDNGKGRSGFLPLDRLSTNGTKGFPPGRGVIGLASNLIRCNEDYRDIVNSILGDTIIVEDFESAISVWPDMSGNFRMVTLDGEVIERNGAIKGGSLEDKQSGIIGRKKQIEEFDRKVNSLSSKFDYLVNEKKKLEADREKILTEISSLESKISKSKDLISKIGAKISNLSFECQRSEQLLQDLIWEEEELKEQSAALMKSMDEGKGELSKFESKEEELSSESQVMEKELRDVELIRNAKAEDLHKLDLAIASLENQLDKSREDLNRAGSQKEEIKRTIELRKSEAKRSLEALSETRDRKEKEEGELKGFHEKLSESEAARDNIEAERQVLLSNSRDVERKLRDLKASQEKFQETLHTLDIKSSELAMQAKGIVERLQDRYNVDISTWGKEKFDSEYFNPDEAERSVQEMRVRIEKMGAVNLAALEDYKAEKERYEFLTKQRDDLIEAEETLEKTISEINIKARAKFLETFEQIRKNFQVNFSKFFEGGEANLNLKEGEDPLEADIGIVARPHGKKLQTISLLSGGERALTAIALLFSIYQFKPSPFCVLDEIDAPLDDANIDRFIRVIKEYSRNTQFMMVTHNKKTMNAADCLHGVTMQESGVSKLVSVRFNKNNGEPELVGAETTQEVA